MLDLGILGDSLRDARGHEIRSSTVVIGFQERHHLPPETADLAVGKNGFQPIANLNAIFVVRIGE